jgi:mevalonate kinase
MQVKYWRNCEIVIVESSAPGKIILMGEHAVVYGAPAIACAIQKRSYCRISFVEDNNSCFLLELENYNESLILPEEYEERGEYESFKGVIEFIYQFKDHFNLTLSGLKITLKSDLPPAMGLGSSASVLSSLAHALNLYFNLQQSKESLNEFIFQGEKSYHATPSGIDNTLCVLGGIVFYQGGASTPLPDFLGGNFLVINSGIPRKTRDMVDRVRKFKENDSDTFNAIIGELTDLALSGQQAIIEGDIITLGTLMTRDHELLRQLGVSHPNLDDIVDTCLSAGAFGAKLTGAGGGGYAIALVGEDILPQLELKLQEMGISFFKAAIDTKGLEGHVTEE